MPETTPLPADAERILAHLDALRATDAPTHGGRVLSYVYDPGLAALDELAARAMRAVQPLNGLDPTTFPSVAAMERELVGFARAMLHGDGDVVGNVTSGGTESCLLAVKTARDRWRTNGGTGTPRLVAPVTAHAAFRKAAALFDLVFDGVPIDADSARLDATRLLARLGDDVALVVVSAPAYPTGMLDPVAEVAAACAAHGIACHVDACFGGWILPWWPGAPLPAWDFRVPGVTSVSADAHKFGYAPKGASVLLQRGRDRHRKQYFATTDWPGYPVVNPTLLGSKSAAPLAAAWAITQWLGADGYARLAAQCAAAAAHLAAVMADIDGLRLYGNPSGPALAVTADLRVPAARRVDPHHWADAVRQRGWLLQQQPGYRQADGSALPTTTHLTITPVTASVQDALAAALTQAADEVRGQPPADASAMLAALPALPTGQLPDAARSAALLASLGVLSPGGSIALPATTAPLLALLAAVPPALAERLLIEVLARAVEPAAAPAG